ncbi:Mpo1-like protein, partial [Undibacterium sp. CCC3.4]
MNELNTPFQSLSKSNTRTVEQLLARYAESHQNPTNEIIHFVCVPVIVWTILGLLWAIHPLAAVGVAWLS